MKELQAAIGSEKASTSQIQVGPQGYLIMYPILDGHYVNVGLWLNRPDPFKDQHVKETSMEKAIPEWDETQRKVMELIGSTTFSPVSYHAKQPSSFFKGRAGLIGDAAHALTPHVGGGFGLAVEDCFVLAEVLRLVNPDEHTIDQIAAAFSAFQEIRKSRFQQLSDSSMKAGQIWTSLYKETLSVEDLHDFNVEITSILKPVWDYDVLDAAEKAIASMKRRAQADQA